MEKQELIELARRAEEDHGELSLFQTEFYPVFLTFMNRTRQKIANTLADENERHAFLQNDDHVTEADFSHTMRDYAELRRLAELVEDIFTILEEPNPEQAAKFADIRSRHEKKVDSHGSTFVSKPIDCPSRPEKKSK